MAVSREEWESLNTRILALETKQMHLLIETNTLKDAVNDNTTALAEWITLGKEFKLGLKVLGYIERAAVWVAKIATAAGITWALWRFGISVALEQLSKK